MAEGTRRLLVPEVVQTSAMDCGPASLKCLLEGFFVHASYGRLREACQTDVDGTSIDTIEDIAIQLGLDAEQIMVPADHVLLPHASVLPAIVIVRLANGFTHFVVAWRRHGPLLQVMDPASGRQWIRCRRFLNDMYIHEARVPAATWREWAASAEALTTLTARLRMNGVHGAAIDRVLASAAAAPGWRALAAADAAGRMVGALVRSGGIARGREAKGLFERLFARTLEDGADTEPVVPRAYWSAWMAPSPSSGAGGNDDLLIRGAVLVTVRGLRQEAPRASTGGTGSDRDAGPISPELRAALDEPPVRPWRTLVAFVAASGARAPAVLLAAVALAAAGVIIEALLFRGVFDAGSHLALSGQRAIGVAVLAALIGGLLLLDIPIVACALGIGRRLEARLRVAFLQKIPRLGDRYFQSRPASDMAERSHSIHQIRLLPDLAAQFARTLCELLFTATAIAWIDPPSAAIAAISASVALALPFLAQPMLRECDLRVRTHTGALGGFYLDAFLGLVAARTHGAESAVRREHESLLVQWARAAFGLQRVAVGIEAAQLCSGFGLAAWLLLNRLGRGGDPGGALLLAYWALNLPMLGQELAHAAWQYPAHRNLMLRLLEPLGALEEASLAEITAPTSFAGAHPPASSRESPASSPQSPASSLQPRGVSIVFDDVTVLAAGHPILRDVSASISAGRHVAIVGVSGAGKSSLAGLLLGWHRPASGTVLVDGRRLTPPSMNEVRRLTAWVDPTVQLWNRSLLENLQYGTSGGSMPSLGRMIDASDLREVLERLPDGLQTPLGESGGSISGGEGQRVRFARGLQRSDARLVILDEPFRGLERERRRDLLERARTLWCDATLLCITHDVGETLAFDRVLVIDDGQIVEDGQPSTLVSQPGSRYCAMIDAEAMVREGLWNGRGWRRLTLDNGRLVDTPDAVRT